jgi:tellurite resistance protein TehA-like permease
MAATSQGAYDHPSYITRQQIFLGRTIAGAAGTSCQVGFPVSAMRIRNIAFNVITANTSVTTNTVLAGTTSIGTIVVGSAAAVNSVSTSGDLNYTLAQGTVLSIKNGTDATGVGSIMVECAIDPASVFTGS